MERSLEDLVDQAERNHLNPDIEADFADILYAAVFALVGKPLYRRCLMSVTRG